MIAHRHEHVAFRHRPEEVAIAQAGKGHVDLGAARVVDPVRRQQAFSFQGAIMQPERAEFGHVARLQVEAVAAGRHTLRVAAPLPVGDTERSEQLFPGVVLGALAGDLRQDRREDMRIAAVVVEGGAGFARHCVVEDVLDPVAAALHLE